ncbi:MAG: Hpt domain-containing protein [Methyloligellaceae bacterium]
MMNFKSLSRDASDQVQSMIRARPVSAPAHLLMHSSHTQLENKLGKTGRTRKRLNPSAKLTVSKDSASDGGTTMEMTVDTVAGIPQDGILRSPHFASRRPIDLVHLARYTLGNRTSEHEVLELFRKQSKLYLQRLKEAAGEHAWRNAAHTIKDSARGIGAWRVAKVAETAETLDHDELTAKQGQIMEALSAQIDEANAYIESLLADA